MVDRSRFAPLRLRRGLFRKSEHAAQQPLVRPPLEKDLAVAFEPISGSRPPWLRAFRRLEWKKGGIAARISGAIKGQRAAWAIGRPGKTDGLAQLHHRLGEFACRVRGNERGGELSKPGARGRKRSFDRE